jgi:MerR family copper efflux transcriptional regulator
MLVSEFARLTGLSPDTVRFYVRRGLLKPMISDKGGSNPYQIFTDEHVQMARLIRMAQSLGFSLREIAVINLEHQARRITPARSAEILRGQLARLEEKAAHVGGMISYIRAKLAWMEAGGKGPEPNFTDYEQASGGVKLSLYDPKHDKLKHDRAKPVRASRPLRRLPRASAGKTLAK